MKKLFAIILSFGLIVSPLPIVSNAHAGGGGYAKVVLGMANGIIGSAILTKCKMGASQPSITAYFAGSVIYIAAEILGGKQKGKDVKKNAEGLDETKATMKEGGDYQKAAVEAQIQNEKDNLKHIQKKRKWMMATKVVYMAAAALAVVELILSKVPPYKPDFGACSPDGVSHVPVQKGIVMAYLAANGYANGGLMGAGLAVATPYIMKMIGMVEVGTKVTDAAVGALNSAVGRIAVFGAAAVLVMMIDKELKKEEDRSKKIIADLEKVKGQFEGSSNALAEGSTDPNGEGANGGAGSLADGSGSNKAYALKALPEGAELAKHCYGKESDGYMNYSESACKNSYKLVKPQLTGKFDIPSLKAGVNSGIDMAQAIADGDTARADVLAGELSAQAGRMGKVQDELFAKANEQLKKEGKKPIDINGEIKRQVAALNDALNKQKSGSGNLSIADINAGDAATSSDIKDGEDANAGNINTASAPTAVPVGAGDDIDLSGIGVGEDGLLNGESAGDPTASLEDSLSEFESAENDISNKSDVSIFKQVSNRYFLNYTKIFDKKKKIDPPLAQPEPANP